MYVPVTEKAKMIRAEIKKAGIPSKSVSVRSHGIGFSSAIDVVIKDHSVDIEIIANIANKFKEISRDNYTGEILMGGNTYVDIKYDYEVRKYWRSLGAEKALEVAQRSGMNEPITRELLNDSNYTFGDLKAIESNENCSLFFGFDRMESRWVAFSHYGTRRWVSTIEELAEAIGIFRDKGTLYRYQY